MRIISRRTLREFWEKHPDSEQPLKAWFKIAKKSEWDTYHDIKAEFRNASIVGNDRVVFNIKGNDYRLVVRIIFEQRKMWIRFIGTHNEYDKTNVKNV